MLFPKKVKYRKVHRGGKTRGLSYRGSKLSFGQFGLKSLVPGALNSREIEAARRAIARYVQRKGKTWVRVFPDHSMTRKGAEVGMGKGKGTPEYFVAKIKPGRIIFEMDGVEEVVARRALRLASDKLSVQTKFVKRDF